MKTRLFALLMVALLCTAATAAPKYAIENVQLGGGLYTFDVVLKSLDGLTLPGDAGYDPALHDLAGYGIAVTLTGADTGDFDLQAGDNNLIVSYDQIIFDASGGTLKTPSPSWRELIEDIDGENYLFETLPGAGGPYTASPNSNVSGDGLTVQQTLISEEAGVGVVPAVGGVLARFQLGYVGSELLADIDVELSLHADGITNGVVDNPNDPPYLLLTSPTNNVVDMEVIPEPATFALLGVGIGAMVFGRRRRSR